MRILLTNDDGIDAPGIQSMYEDLAALGDITVVAPVEDQSEVGRQLSSTVEIHDHDLGYAVAGTPTDCIVAAIGALDINPDIVVAGCNLGANLGEYVLGRSGTVSAAVEAAFFEIPAIATSVYVPVKELSFQEFDPSISDFRAGTKATAYLVEHGIREGIFSDIDYLNVNAPITAESGSPIMEITSPSHVYQMDAHHMADGSITIHDKIWEQMASGKIEDPPGTDRYAVVKGRVSVSPLTAPHTANKLTALQNIASRYSDGV